MGCGEAGGQRHVGSGLEAVADPQVLEVENLP
jgi:hypothetical protein